MRLLAMLARVDESEPNAAALQVQAKSIRQIILRQSMRAHVGHIGSALSVADILAVLYGTLHAATPRDPDRDRVVLSKGHAALGLYAALHLRGWLSAAQLDTYCADGTMLGVHPEVGLPGVDFSTGSLGQGLSFASGAALAARLQSSRRHIFAVMSDAEMNEGSVWEAAMFAAHHHLENLTLIVDLNGQQALGYTRNVVDLAPVSAIWEAFGWRVLAVDGHDHGQLLGAMRPATGTRPTVVLAQTTFGRGVSFMENRIEWHYLPMSEKQYQTALLEVEASR
jgi:transketolase